MMTVVERSAVLTIEASENDTTPRPCCAFASRNCRAALGMQNRQPHRAGRLGHAGFLMPRQRFEKCANIENMEFSIRLINLIRDG